MDGGGYLPELVAIEFDHEGGHGFSCEHFAPEGTKFSNRKTSTGRDA